jgi:uncharacterized protein (TIGR03086 family)
MTGPALPAPELLRRAVDVFEAKVHAIGADQWRAPTPCPGWDVASLVNHVVAENRWSAPLVSGLTPAEVGDAFAGDLLGAKPLLAWRTARAVVEEAAGRDGVTNTVVHLSAGDVDGAEYFSQLAADNLLHAWDLAVAIGTDTSLDPELVAAVGGWFMGQEGTYRAAGAVGPRPPVEHDADPQTRLLAMFGRSVPTETDTAEDVLAAVDRFGAAFDRQEIDGVMAAMTTDCVFEGTSPPDGVRHVGQSAVRAAWADFFASAPDAQFSTEERFACGNRVVARWRFHWGGDDGGHIRGVDIFTIREGLVAEKLSYVKG